MKSRNKALLFVMCFVLVAVSIVTNNVNATANQEYNTTIIDSDGLEIEVADINSSEITDIEEYIKQNINEAYAKSEKLEPKDIIYIKHLIADGSYFKGEKTIDAMYEDQEDAFIMMNDFGMLLYDTDENSDYYVAYVDTLHDDSVYTVTDYCFAYTNLNGETIDDAIYDYETGIAYVPKKYTEENKNGQGVLNVQIELLQITDTQNPTSTFNVSIEVDENITGSFATSGTATVEAISTKFGLKIALDDEAKENITENYFKVLSNDTETHNWEYYPNEGILVLENIPNTIESLKISISEDNIDENVDYMMQNGGLSAYASESESEIDVYDPALVWIVDEMPNEGDSWYVEGNPDEGYDAAVVDVYYAGTWEQDRPIYTETSDTTWLGLVDKILNDNNNIDLENLTKNSTWIQHDVRFNRDVNIDGKITIPAGADVWLKCAHNAVSFSAYSERSYDKDGEPRDHAWKVKIKIYKITDNYMIVGFLTSQIHNQAGTGLYKIAYTGGNGELEVGKKDEWDNWIGGAKLAVSGPDGYYQEVISEDGHPTSLGKVKKGTYTVRELESTANTVRNDTPSNFEVESNEKTTAYIKNNYKRGSVQLTKYDERNRGNTQGDATLEGAEYNLYAAEDIFEGQKQRYSQNELIKSGIVTKADGTTDPVGDLPIGKYYYKEIKPSEGFNINHNTVSVEITANELDPYQPANGYNVAPEEPIYNSIEIYKYIGETASSKKSPLAGAEFTATLESSIGTDNVKTYKCTAPTDENGYCIIEDLPYGHYIIEETKVPELTLKCSDFKLFVQESESTLGRKYRMTDVEFVDPKNTLDYVVKDWLDSRGYLEDEPKVMKIKIRKVDKDGWEGNEKVDFTQGDAVLKGAIYSIYEWDESTNSYSKQLMDIKVDHKDEEGYWCAEQDNLIVGKKYMVKEKVKSTETKDGVTIKYSYAEGYLVDETEYEFYQEPKTQTTKRTYHEAISKEEVVRGSIEVIKYNNNPESTEEVPSKGAILRLTLDSDENIWYEVTIDENGYGNFLDKNDGSHTTAVKTCYGEKYYPYTIPYGEYTITEIQESNPKEHTSYFIQPESVVLTKDMQKEYRIESDEPISVWLRVTKVDKSTSEWRTVGLPGAEFKVWDVSKKEWVKWMVNPYGDEYVLKTNEDGYLYTPQQLYPGKYVIYETKAPEGYYLQDEWRLPEDKEALGDASVSGKEIIINKVSTGIKDETVYPEGGIKVGELEYEVKIPDNPLTVNLEIHKKAEKLTGVTTSTVEYPVSETEKQREEKYTGTYTMEGLEGVGYKVYAVRDTYTPDGIKRYDEDEEVADITTNSEGIAIAEKLFPGEYRIVEYKTPDGYLRDDNIPNVILENEDQYVETATLRKELNDKRQKLQLTFEKIFEEIDFANEEEPEQKALFGVYAKNEIKDYKNNRTLIPADGLVDLIWTDENNDVTSTIDLPEGTYYVRELYVSYPYILNIEDQEFVLEYNGDETQEFNVKQGDSIDNGYDSSSITLVKLSSTTVDNVVLNGEEIDTSELDETVQEILETMKGMTEAEIREYFENSEVDFVAGAKYRVYTDEACQKPLYIKNEETGKFEVADIITNDTGIVKLENVPLGEYWIKEIEAPAGYELSEEKVRITLDLSNKNTMVYQALIENSVIKPLITKLDIFTGEAISNCTFEIADETGKVLLHSVTNEEGKAYIPLVLFENGKTYTYTEIEAPDIYDLNTEPHEFVAEISEDMVWLKEPIPVENRRKTRKVIVRKLDADTSDPLEGCVFTIALIDEETGEQKVNAKTGEPIYLVENATTDENGEYVIDEAPMGTYRFTEIKAPEGYELDEDLTGYEFTINNDSPETIIFEVTNTGDIAVVAIVCMGIICIAGIAFVIIRNRKQKLQKKLQ